MFQYYKNLNVHHVFFSYSLIDHETLSLLAIHVRFPTSKISLLYLCNKDVYNVFALFLENNIYADSILPIHLSNLFTSEFRALSIYNSVSLSFWLAKWAGNAIK